MTTDAAAFPGRAEAADAGAAAREMALLAENRQLRRQLAEAGLPGARLAAGMSVAAEGRAGAADDADPAGSRALGAALRAGERRLRLVLDSAIDFAIVTVDPGGRVTG